MSALGFFSIKHNAVQHLILDKFQLNGGRVDAFVVKERFDFFGSTHVVGYIETLNVRCSNDTVTSQLPHVKLVDVAHAAYLVRKNTDLRRNYILKTAIILINVQNISL